MDEDKKIRVQMSGIKAANSLIDGVSKVTHYQSYHAYRRSLRLSNWYLLLAFLIGCCGLVPTKATSTGVFTSIVIVMLLAYFFLYYWIMAKAAKLKKDSDRAMLQVAFNGILSSGWSIYDGIYDVGGVQSLEITFTKEQPFISNVWFLIRKEKRTLPLTENDILNLKYYLAGLTSISSKSVKYIAYATLDDNLVAQLQENGILVNEISRRYRTKPGRWNYAVTTGIVSNALQHYPHFEAYQLQVEEDIQNQKYDSSRSHKRRKLSKRERKLKQLVTNHRK